MMTFTLCQSALSVYEALLNTLDEFITNLMVTAQREVVDRGQGNVTAKFHLPEDHVVSCMKRFRVVLGLLSGQGDEDHHHESNILNTSLGRPS